MAYKTRPQHMREVLFGIIDAKPTEYRGILMRSRLEVDFARHLDDIGAVWTYEPRIFGTKGSGYLPDFVIERPDGYHFIEVKPTLEEVPLAKKRMEVIWATHPDAVLIVACAKNSQWFSAERGQPWESWIERWKHVAA